MWEIKPNAQSGAAFRPLLSAPLLIFHAFFIFRPLLFRPFSLQGKGQDEGFRSESEAHSQDQSKQLLLHEAMHEIAAHRGQRQIFGALESSLFNLPCELFLRLADVLDHAAREGLGLDIEVDDDELTAWLQRTTDRGEHVLVVNEMMIRVAREHEVNGSRR